MVSIVERSSYVVTIEEEEIDNDYEDNDAFEILNPHLAILVESRGA